MCFKLGCGEKKIILQAGIHAREYITTLFLLKEIEYLKNFALNCEIYVVPMMNPDGIQLVLTNAINNHKKFQFLKRINCGDNFSLFKANVNGVDLNTNFDADWGKGKNNIKTPASENYVGHKPESEKETCALVEFTKKIKPTLTISYHCKGEVVYFGFDGLDRKFFKQQKQLAKLIGKTLKYKISKAKGSVGGYKDFCLKQLSISSFTVEVGNDKFSHPFPTSQLGIIFNQNKNLPLVLMKHI